MNVSKLLDLTTSNWGISGWSATKGYGIFGNSKTSIKVTYYDYDAEKTKVYTYSKMGVGYQLGKYEGGATTVQPCENCIIFFDEEGTFPLHFLNTAINTFYLTFINFPRDEDMEKLIEWMSANGERMSGGIIHKFSKLYLGNTATTSGNKCFKKLNTQPTLTTPSISITDDILNIVDNEGKAKRFEIFIDGELVITIGVKNWDISNLNLENGNYSIYVIAKATGYIDSKESNTVTYVVDKPVFDGTNLKGTTWELSMSPEFSSEATYSVDFTYKRYPSAETETANELKLILQDWMGDGVPSEKVICYGSQSVFMEGWNGESGYINVITFTGGTDISNPDLIAWLQKYGSIVT